MTFCVCSQHKAKSKSLMSYFQGLLAGKIGLAEERERQGESLRDSSSERYYIFLHWNKFYMSSEKDNYSTPPHKIISWQPKTHKKVPFINPGENTGMTWRFRKIGNDIMIRLHAKSFLSHTHTHVIYTNMCDLPITTETRKRASGKEHDKLQFAFRKKSISTSFKTDFN